MHVNLVDSCFNMNKPFKLKPIYKDYIWGGQKIINNLHKDTNINPCAEAWEFSSHTAGVSFCDSGEYKGIKINEIFKMHPEYLGRFSNPNGDIPILIKYIDAKEDLSIQVHPSDAYALKNENSLGKSEVWYILESDNGHLSVGFNKDVNKDIVKKSIEDGTILNHLNNFSVSKGEYLPIDAGTIHAINAGCLLIEVQENSDLTYRIFDYNRKDSKGNKRPLHIEKALDVLDYKKYDKPSSNSLKYSCKYFNLSVIDTPCEICTTKNNFMVLMCIEDSCIIKAEDEELPMNYGDSVFVPADCKITINNKSKLLKVEV